MYFSDYILNNCIEIFGAAAGILYVFLEIRQNIWLWPVGIVTSAVYIWVFFTGKLYADMSLQGYYLVISVLGWYWWIRGTGHNKQKPGTGNSPIEETVLQISKPAEKREHQGDVKLKVTRLKAKTGIILTSVFIALYTVIWLTLDRLTDSPVPEWDSFITSLSIIATWMLARKIYEHWYLWIVVNVASVILFITRGFYPTMILYIVYCVMSFVGLKAWKRTIT